MTILTSEQSETTTTESQPILVPLADALKQLGIKRQTAYLLIKAGHFPVETIKIGARHFVRSVDLDELRKRAKPAPPD